MGKGMYSQTNHTVASDPIMTSHIMFMNMLIFMNIDEVPKEHTQIGN